MILPRGKWAVPAAPFLAAVCAAQTVIPRVPSAPVPVVGGAAAPAALSAPSLFPAMSAPMGLVPAAAAPLAAAPALLPALAAPDAAAAPAAAPAAAEAVPPALAPSASFASAAAVPVGPAEKSAPGDLASASAEAARIWDGAARRGTPDDASALAAALVTGGASPGFVAAVREHVARSYAAPVLRGLLDAGYRVEANAHVRQNRPELDENNDLISGYHRHDAIGKLVIIGETVRDASGKNWEKSRTWENAVNHELGLAIGRTLGDAAAARLGPAAAAQAGWLRSHGASESLEFREAWRQDFARIPSELKQAKDQDGEFNDFFYFLEADKNGFFHEARERTFAEGMDILLRGPSSAYNYDDFMLYFPKTLAALRREMETSYGWTIAQPPAPPQRHGPWEDPKATRANLAGQLVSGAASPAFVARVRAHVAKTFPPDVLRALLGAGYRIAADATVRQGREGLHEDNDTRGGFHSHGTSDNLIVVAEKVKLIGSNEWVDSAYWENAINHEIGHALAYINGEAEAQAAASVDPRQARWYRKKGASESPAFREAWRQDYEAMPAEMKKQWGADKLENKFYYYVHPDAGDLKWFQRARQETYAEGFDVLLRGAASSYNYENFKRYFPRALAELKRELGTRYTGLFHD
jgi:hypothetical protein